MLSGAYWICIISPLFLMGLLLFVSGVPLQEKQAGLPLQLQTVAVTTPLRER